jgi:4-carboxymuconolactone decarboxylase
MVTGQIPNLGGRLPLAEPKSLNVAQRDLFDAVTATQVPWANDAGVQTTTADGRLIGPFNAFLLHPEVSSKFLEFFAAEAVNTSLTERVREILILAVGAVWRADYEIYSHKAFARKAGLSEDAVSRLSDGQIPADLSEHEKIAALLARELSITHRISADLYEQGEKAFGTKGLFDIAALMGLYHTACAVLTLFEVPAPA